MHDNRPAEAPDRCAGKIAVDVDDLVVGQRTNWLACKLHAFEYTTFLNRPKFTSGKVLIPYSMDLCTS